MRSILFDEHSENWKRLLQLYVGASGRIIDFTYGTGQLWRGLIGYEVTKCDTQEGDGITVRNIFSDNYSDLGVHDAGVFDPPYLIGRQGFDYRVKVLDGRLIPATQGKGNRGWAASEINRFTANPDLATFNKRVQHLNAKAPATIKLGGFLFVKVMDVRHNGKFIPHHVSIVNELTNFQIEHMFVYVRSGSNTWVSVGRAMNFHGYWMVFRKKEVSN